MLKNLVLSNRSYRRFDEEFAIKRETMEELIELARLSASASNRQPLKYYLASDPEVNEKIFPTLGWAGALKNWDGPEPDERPSAYIVILGDKHITEKFNLDPGIAAQSILLGATEKGLGGCMIGSVNPSSLREKLNLEDHFEILLVIALGKPAEKVVVESLGENGNTAYYRDEEDIHHVPKRSLDEIIIN